MTAAKTSDRRAEAALGSRKALTLFMPERDSDEESLRLGRMVADCLGVESVLEDIEPILTASACYKRRDDFIRALVPGFGRGWGRKVVLANSLRNEGYNITYLVVRSSRGAAFRR
jgi:NAD+ synthase